MITNEMKEAILYLSDKENYMVFAGFATYLQTGIESSADIDIYLKSKEDFDGMVEELVSQGWKKVKEGTDNTHYWHACLEKNGSTLDLVYSKSTAEVCFPLKQKFERDGIELYALSTELLFLEKLNQLSSIKRTEKKTERDREAVSILRKMLDLDKLRAILPQLKDIYWREGYL